MLSTIVPVLRARRDDAASALGIAEKDYIHEDVALAAHESRCRLEMFNLS